MVGFQVANISRRGALRRLQRRAKHRKPMNSFGSRRGLMVLMLADGPAATLCRIRAVRRQEAKEIKYQGGSQRGPERGIKRPQARPSARERQCRRLQRRFRRWAMVIQRNRMTPEVWKIRQPGRRPGFVWFLGGRGASGSEAR